MVTALHKWIDRNVFELGREMRWSYLPPLMVYLAAGISGLTGIVGTFFVKDYLGLSASFLAALGFWAGIPWALKMPIGHLVDLIWRWKSVLVYLGAKQLQYLADAQMAGIVVGTRVPIVMTSRADSPLAHMASCALALLLAQSKRKAKL